MNASPIGKHLFDVATWNPATHPMRQFCYIDLSAVDQSQKTIVAARTLLGEDAPSRARQFVHSGDVLLSTVRPNLNGVARIEPELDGATASTGFCVLRANEVTLSGAYLFHWVRSQAFVDDMVRKATGASYPAVSDRIVLDSKLPLPSIGEQRRIAAILDQAEALRAKRQEALAKLDTLTQSLFLEMFGDPRHNPKGWATAPMEQLAEVSGGLQITPKRKQERIKVPYLRVANVYRDRIDLSEIKTLGVTDAELKRTTLRKGDLLIVEGHGNPEEIGRCAVWNGQISECVHQNHLIRARFNKREMLPCFASAYLNSKVGREQVLRSGKTTSGLNTLSTTNVKAFKIYVPPKALQDEFLSALCQVERLGSSLKSQLGSSKHLVSSLQHRAFRGEL